MISYFFIVLGLLIVIVFVSHSDIFSSTTTFNKDNIDSPVNVTMNIVSPGWNVQYEKNYETSVTVADLLFDCSEEHGFIVEKKFWQGYDSFFIMGINGINNGEDDRYWQFYVNDNYSNVGCSSYYLRDNDVVSWKFEVSKLV